MSQVPAAARRLDYIKHDFSMLGKFGGLVVWLALGYRGLKVGAAFTGLPGLAALGLTWAMEWVLSTALEKFMEGIGGLIKTEGVPEIKTGSDNVFTNSIPAARGGPKGDMLNCLSHGSVKIAQGSRWVYINNQPGSRIDDRTECSGGGVLAINPANPPCNVFFGGDPTDADNSYWFHDFVKFTDLGGKVGVNLLEHAFKEALEEGGKAAADKVADTLWKLPAQPMSSFQPLPGGK